MSTIQACLPVCITDGDEWKTALRTCYESFEWSVMLFGLTNASVAFQQFMSNIFSNLLDVYVVIYLDDIPSTQTTCPNTTSMLKKYSSISARLVFMSKCKFHSKSVEYLGYIISPSSLTMSDNKVKIIQDWPKPKKVKNIQSFLGFTNFYHWFIFNYSDIVTLLTCLTQKDIPWKFDFSCCDAFNFFKKTFTSALILTHCEN